MKNADEMPSHKVEQTQPKLESSDAHNNLRADSQINSLAELRSFSCQSTKDNTSQYLPTVEIGGYAGQGGFPSNGKNAGHGGFPHTGDNAGHGGFPHTGDNAGHGGFPHTGDNAGHGGFPKPKRNELPDGSHFPHLAH